MISPRRIKHDNSVDKSEGSTVIIGTRTFQNGPVNQLLYYLLLYGTGTRSN